MQPRSLLSPLLPAIGAAALGMLAVPPAGATVPPNIEEGLRKIGPIVDPVCTARLYRPLMPKADIASGIAQPYTGITVTRNQSFGADPKDVVDVFVSDKGPATRPVLVFVPGGAGDKTEIQDKADNAFYDNIGRWATDHGFVGVLMQRKASATWDGGARDISAMLTWVQAHISDYHGNSDDLIIWAHSAGNVPMGTYLGHPELYTAKGVGVRGAIFMSGAPFDIAPVTSMPMGVAEVLGRAGSSCSGLSGLASATGTLGALPGAAPGAPGGPPIPNPNAFRPGSPPSAAEQLARSSLPTLQKAPFKMLIVNGELDPPALIDFGRKLHDATCEAGSTHCARFVLAKGEDHMSLVFSIDSIDKTVERPVLAFINSVR